MLRLPEYQAAGSESHCAQRMRRLLRAAETRVYLVFEPGSPY